MIILCRRRVRSLNGRTNRINHDMWGMAVPRFAIGMDDATARRCDLALHGEVRNGQHIPLQKLTDRVVYTVNNKSSLSKFELRALNDRVARADFNRDL